MYEYESEYIETTYRYYLDNILPVYSRPEHEEAAKLFMAAARQFPDNIDPDVQVCFTAVVFL